MFVRSGIISRDVDLIYENVCFVSALRLRLLILIQKYFFFPSVCSNVKCTFTSQQV